MFFGWHKLLKEEVLDEAKFRQSKTYTINEDSMSTFVS